MSVQRGYSLLHVKSVDGEQRVIAGIATSPTLDRVGDSIDPFGAQFAEELPLLLYHDTMQPVGSVRLGKPTKAGIPFTAQFADPAQIRSEKLRERVMEAWDSVRLGLIRGVSVGFRTLADGIEALKGGGLRFTKTELLELSLVVVPANSEATIDVVRSLDAVHLAASGMGDSAGHPPAVAGPRAATRGSSMKTITEQKAAFVAEKDAKVQKLNDLMANEDAGTTLDASKQEEFDTITSEVEAIDKHLARLETLERVNMASARPVQGDSTHAASAARQGSPIITTRSHLPPGIGFARAILCQAAARFENQNVMEIAKARYPDHSELHNYLQVKAVVPAGTTTETTWASPLVYAQNLTSEFIEYMRPMTILGAFGTGSVPSLTRVPFNVRIPSQTSAGDAYWVGQGAPKPLTAFGYGTVTLGYNKVAAISVITRELARFSTPSAEQLVRDSLAREVAHRIDTDFIDPSHAVSAGVSPASITNGLTALTPTGTAAANVITDLSALVAAFVENNYPASNLVLIMPNTLALALSLMTNSLGQPEFPGMSVTGGSLKGIPVIASQYAANLSGGGNLVVAVSPKDIFLADDGGITVDVSQEASLQMLDNPTNNSASGTATTMVSMFQTNSMAIRAEREITWAKARTDCVVYMDDVNWGSIGSPA